METVGERLREALAKHPDGKLSIRQFQKLMEEQEVRGTSYPQIHRYLANRMTPSIEFLEAAASLVQCRTEWLAHGTGARTEEEEALRRAQDERLPEAGWSAALEDLLPGFDDLPEIVQYRFCGLLADYEDSTRGVDQEALGRFARQLFWSLIWPARLEPQIRGWEERWEDYMLGVLQAASGLMTTGQRGRLTALRDRIREAEDRNPLVEELERLRGLPGPLSRD